MDLPADLRTNLSMGYYDAGHMMYVNRPSLIQLKQDLTKFIHSAVPPKESDGRGCGERLQDCPSTSLCAYDDWVSELLQRVEKSISSGDYFAAADLFWWRSRAVWIRWYCWNCSQTVQQTWLAVIGRPL